MASGMLAKLRLVTLKTLHDAQTRSHTLSPRVMAVPGQIKAWSWVM
jgi:hypothetical protein